MPLYEYQCLNCGKKTEVIQKFEDAPLAACPSCGGEVKKLISSPAFQFKGTGWYVTDYAGKKGGGGPESKSDGKSEGGDKGEKSDKGESSSKSGDSDKAGKAERAEKSEKSAAAEAKSSSGGGGAE